MGGKKKKATTELFGAMASDFVKIAQSDTLYAQHSELSRFFW